METISISEFKSKALSIIARIAGTGESVVITKHGNPMVTVVPHKETRKPQPGLLQGTILDEKDIVSPLAPDDWEANR